MAKFADSGMISRFRLLTALLALLTFGFAGAEPLWASVSAKAPENVAVCLDLMSGDRADGSQHSSAPTAPCSSMPAGMPGTCSALVVALPAAPRPDLSLLGSAGILPTASFDAPVLLLARGLFRPPRA